MGLQRRTSNLIAFELKLRFCWIKRGDMTETEGVVGGGGVLESAAANNIIIIIVCQLFICLCF